MPAFHGVITLWLPCTGAVRKRHDDRRDRVCMTRRWRELDSNLRFRARAVSGFAPEGPNVGIQLFQRRAGRSPFPPPGHFRESADNEDCAGREAPAPHTSSPGDRWPSIAAGRTQRPHQGHPSRSIPPSPRSRRRNRKFADSPPEGSGFELLVPRGDGASGLRLPNGDQCASASCPRRRRRSRCRS